MPKQRVIERTRRAKRAGKPASAQAGEFVREQMRRIGSGTFAPRSLQQAVAIGLSEARRSGVVLPRKRKVKKTARKGATVGLGEEKPPAKRRRPVRTAQRRKTTKTKTARRPAPKPAAKRAAKSAARRPAAAPRRPARKPAARRPAPLSKRTAPPKSITKRAAAAQKSGRVTRVTGPSAAERAPARKAVAARESRRTVRSK